MAVESVEVAAGCEASAFLEQGQQSLRQGDPAAAVKHLEDSIAVKGGDTIDTRLLLAEALWQESAGKGTEKALDHYVKAGEMALQTKDHSKQAMIGLGYGFALTHLGRAAEAVDVLSQAKEAAAADGNPQAVQFVEKLLDQAKSLAAEGSKPLAEADSAEAVLVTWRLFAEARASGKKAVLFMRGTLAAPSDHDGREGIEKLKQAGCQSIEVVNVEDLGDDVPDGLQAISNSSHLALPQLFISGAECEGLLSPFLTVAALRKKLEDVGMELGELKEEPCHGTETFAEGLEAWETALVQLVSQHGIEDLPLLAKEMRSQGHEDAILAAEEAEAPEDAPHAIRAAWDRLAPLVKDKLENQPDMPCGHTCNTCPTRHDCQLHDALGEEPKDIEDLIVSKSKKKAEKQ